MSKKLKELRIAEGLSKTVFAEKLGVTYRTVTNWEKEDGIVPSIETMERIAEVLETHLFKIYSCFMYDPDNCSNEEETLPWKTWSDISKNFYKKQSASSFFKYIAERKYWGNGVLNFNNNCFYFSRIVMNYKQLEEQASLEDQIQFFSSPAAGVLLLDVYYNAVWIDPTNLNSWCIKSEQYGNIVFELRLKTPISKETDCLNSKTKSYPVTLTLLNTTNQSLSNVLTLPKYFTLKKEKVLSNCIKHIREKRKLTQQKYAEELSYYLMLLGFNAIDKNTVCKWENGTLIPNAHQLNAMEAAFNVSIDTLLDQYHYEYFMEEAIFKEWKSYDIGLKYSFSKIQSELDIWDFIRQFCLVRDTLWSSQESILAILFLYDNSDNEEDFRQIIIYELTQHGSSFELLSDTNETILVELEKLYMWPSKSNYNFLYRFQGEYAVSDSESYSFDIGFHLFAI